MPEPHASPVAATAPILDALEVAWTRIQVTIRLRSVGGSIDAAAGLSLVRDDAAAVMAPTHAETDGDRITLRFNVMQGPRRVPLDPGRWRLAAGEGDGAHRTPVTIADPGPLASGAAVTAEFALGRGLYGVVVTIDPIRRNLVLVVSLDPDRGIRSVADAPDGAEADPNTAGEPRDAMRRRRLRRIIRPLRGASFSLVLRIARLAARRNGRRILFTSDSRSELGGNLKLVHDRMLERGLDRDHEVLTLFKPGIATSRSLADRFRMPWLLARADTIVIDDFQPAIYRVTLSDVRIVQLWHAVGAFKTVGYSRVGKLGAPDPYGRVHKNYTHVTVSSEADVPVYAEAFGIPEDRVVATGIPRTDRFFDPAYGDRARELAREAFPEARGRTVILVAPTFRGIGAKTATYDMDRLDFPALHAVCLERDAVCIVRMHPFVRAPLRIPPPLTDRILDGQRTSIDVNDLLFAVDLLVTDYSSIVYEFSTLDRPMLFYAYDLDDYVAGRDFYEPYESFVPGRIVRTSDELLDAIRRDEFDAEKVAPFAARHFSHHDGGSTDRVVDLIVGADGPEARGRGAGTPGSGGRDPGRPVPR